jgi:hypothetical protein
MNMNAEFEIEQEFNSNISVTELWMKTLENTTKDFGLRIAGALSEKYNFPQEEAVKFLGLEGFALIRKQMAKKSVPKEKKEKKPKAEKPAKKLAVPIPFGFLPVNEQGCCGLAFNHGLFTQCPKSRMENGTFCKSCQEQADKNTSGEPDCGTIEKRNAEGANFKDSKGRTPTPFALVLKKLKIPSEVAQEEFGKLNLYVESSFFEIPEKKGSGRPKKSVTIAEIDELTDHFANLTAEDPTENKSKKAKLTEEEKAQKKAELERERNEKAEMRKQELEQKKVEREVEKAKKEAEKAAEKAKKEAEKAAEKAKKEAEKAKKEAEKAKKDAEKAKKDAEKAKKEAAKKPEEKPAEKPAEKPEEKPAGEKTKVKKIKIEGKEYFLAVATNILYDPATKEEVGIFKDGKIEPLPEEDDEEVEEDYDN